NATEYRSAEPERPTEDQNAAGETGAARPETAARRHAPPPGKVEDTADGDADALDEESGDETEPSEAEPSMWELFRDDFLTFDRRTLGFTRILLGFFLIGDLFRRAHAWIDMFADIGVLPNNVNLWRPQGSGHISLVNAFSTSGELWVLWA